MQRCNCTVRLGGDVANTVEKENVSPAEIVVLTAIHGEGSVVNIRKTIMDKEPHRQERARLATAYGQPVVDKLFPGEFTNLPVTLDQINIGAPAEEADEADAAEDVGLVGNDAGVDEAVEETPPVGLSEDDQAFVDSVNNAKSKMELYAIAKKNEVDLSKSPDKMEDLKAAILTAMGFNK